MAQRSRRQLCSNSVGSWLPTKDADAMFLTADNIENLTGYVQAAAQIKWLRKNGITHFVRGDGRPVVPTNAFASEKIDGATTPNFTALRGRH